MKPSVTTVSHFRELSGAEMLTVVVQTFSAVLAAEVKRSGHFEISTCYPVVRMTGELRLKVLPGEKLPDEYIIPFDVCLPDRQAVELSAGEETIIDTKATLEREIGTVASNAPDRIREEYGLPVLQPQKDEKGQIRNMPVGRK